VLLHEGASRVGVGHVKSKEVSGAYCMMQEVELYTAEGDGSSASNTYEALAQRGTDAHLALDVFSAANTPASLADVVSVSELTGGHDQHMPQSKQKARNLYHLRNPLQMLTDRNCGSEAVFMVRASAGQRVGKLPLDNFSRSAGARRCERDDVSVIDQEQIESTLKDMHMTDCSQVKTSGLIEMTN
jgi:hypothetical protein